MKMDRVIMGGFVTIVSWMILNSLLFPQRSAAHFKSRLIRYLLETIVLVGIQTFCVYSLPTAFAPIVLIACYSISLLMRGHGPFIQIFVESSLSFCASLVLGLVCYTLSILFFTVLGNQYNPYLRFAVKTLFQTAGLVLAVLLFKKRKVDFTPQISKHMIVILSLSFVFFLGSYGFLRQTNGRDDGRLGTYVVITLIAFFTQTVLWIRLEIVRARDYLKVTTAYAAALRSSQSNVAIVHHVREIISGLSIGFGRVVEQISRAPGAPDTRKMIRQFTGELDDLCKTVGRQAREEAMNGPSFESSGVIVLDSMLERMKCEALDADVDILCKVVHPATSLIEKGVIGPTSLSAVVGDLLRNSIYWVEAAPVEYKRVMVMMYERDGIYHIEVSDNGPLFPAKVLDRLGQRGNTTKPDGTGNGYPDILQALISCNASLEIEELPSDGLHTKSVRIRFDGEGLFSIESTREGVRRAVPISELLARSEQENSTTASL